MEVSAPEDAQPATGSALGERILVVGASCSGKSTLAQELASRCDLEFVELDALFWEPGWQEPDAEVFGERIRAALQGQRWVVAGNYLRHTMPLTWPQAETVIWLDLPLAQTIWRIGRRSYRRWRQQELLWGTNIERFWPQFKVWDQESSLIAFNVANHRRRKRAMLAAMRDERWRHIRFVRLHSSGDVTRLLTNL